MPAEVRTQPEDAASKDGKESTAAARPAPGRARILVRWIPLLAVLAFALVLVPRLADYFGHSWQVLTFPWQIDFDEGVNLNASWLLANGTNIYRPYETDHFVSALYPPLYYALNALALKLWGLNLWSGRLLAWIGALGVGAGLWAWVKVETGKHAAGALAALLWLSLGPVYIWSTFYKQDMPALALGVLGGAMAAPYFRGRVSDRTGERWLYWSIVPLALSFWMKQSSLAPIAAVGLGVLIRDWRQAIRWGAWAAGALVVPFIGLALLTKGGFLEHMLAFTEFGRSAARFTQRSEKLWDYAFPLVLCGVAFLALFLVWPVARKKQPSLSALFLLISIPATVLGILHPTGNYNHLLSILAPLCLAAGVALGAAWGAAETGRIVVGAAGMVALALVAVAQVGIQAPRPSQVWYTPLSMPLEERAAQMEKISQLVASTPGDVFSEDAWMLLKNGKRVLYDDPAGMAALANAGAWDQSELLQDLNRRKFPLLLLEYDLTDTTYNPRWTNQALTAARANYQILFRDVLFAHTPRPPDGAPQTQVTCTIETGATLSGYTFRSPVANHGDALPLSLYWRGTPGPNMKYFVRLVDESGAPKWGADLVPGQAASGPQQEGTARDDLGIPIDDSIPFGSYRLILGAYTVNNGQITALNMACTGSANKQADGTLLLSNVEVRQRWGK